jgi:polyisoprenyl-teichoic acid--peptidoglycan teichoic acid transferase
MRLRWYAIGAVLVLLLGGATYIVARTTGGKPIVPNVSLPGRHASPSPSPSPLPGIGLSGPLNILIAGVDTREAQKDWIPRSDSIMVMHVDATLTHAYLTSLPRDLYVSIPAYPPAHFGGERTKLTHAMFFGSQVPGSPHPSTARGLDLLSRTVRAYTHIPSFDVQVVLTFNGLRKLIDRLGGIDIYIDEKTVSIHMRPDGQLRTPCGRCAHGYSGPQAVYNVGMRHLVGWQALDYARQRYIPGSDYARQRHQQQIIKAAVAKAMSGGAINSPNRLFAILDALSSTLLFVDGKRSPVDYAYAMRNLQPTAITLTELPGTGVYSGGTYLGEALNGIQAAYFAALRGDQLGPFVAAHRNMVA